VALVQQLPGERTRNRRASWNQKSFAIGQTKNAPAIAGTGGPNMFLNPQPGLDAFQYVMPGEIGNRNPVRGDGMFHIEAALMKRLYMPSNEKHSMQFRWEVFNVSNTVWQVHRPAHPAARNAMRPSLRVLR
jgi:hypothetical protein